METDAVIKQLLDSDVPSIRYRTRVRVLGEDPDAAPLRRLRSEIATSGLVAELLTGMDESGRIARPASVYAKWQGAHWILAALADIDYPPGDEKLLPLRDQVQQHWLSNRFQIEFPASSKAAAYRGRGVPVMQQRHRRCASQQSNALWSVLRLGLVNDQTHELVERLLHWQWPDGGWNCDKNPDACHSSFMESIIPLRALSLYGRTMGDADALKAASRAAQIFLKRQLFQRQHDGSTIKKEFVCLHYPLYWHYDILHGLKVLAEAGFIADSRCVEALDLLESKRLEDGGWPAEKKYYRFNREIKLGNDNVDWGGTSSRRMNPWVTTDALCVLRAAGRLQSFGNG